MSYIALLRQSIPQYKDKSDEEIVEAFGRANGMDAGSSAQFVGYKSGNGMWGNRMGASIDNYQAGLQGTLEAGYDAVGLPDYASNMRKMRQANEREANITSDLARKQGAISSYKDVEGVGSGLNYVGGLAVDSFPYAAEALIGGGVGGLAMKGTRAAARLGAEGAATRLATGRTAAGVATSYPSSVGDVLQSQREQTDGEVTDLLSAGVGGVGYAGLNALGVTGMLARGSLGRNVVRSFDDIQGLKGAAARGGSKAAIVGATESAGETGQEFINQAGRMQVDPNETFFNEESNERFAESAVGGFALGGALGGPGGMRRSKDYQAPNSLLPNTNVTADGTDQGMAAAINHTYTQQGELGLAPPPAMGQQGELGIDGPPPAQFTPAGANPNQMPASTTVLPPGVMTQRTGVDPAKPPKPAKPQPPAAPSQEERAAVIAKYGEPGDMTHDGTAEGRKTGVTWLGKPYSFDQQEKLEADINKAAEEERTKPTHVKVAERAYMAAYAYMYPTALKSGEKKPLSPAALKNMMTSLGVNSASNPNELIDQIDAQIAYETKGKKQGTKPSLRVDLLGRMREELTGETETTPGPTEVEQAITAINKQAAPTAADKAAAALGPKPDYKNMNPIEKMAKFMELSFGQNAESVKAVIVDRMSHEKAAALSGRSRQRIGHFVDKEGKITELGARKAKAAGAEMGLSDQEVEEYLRPTQGASLVDDALAGEMEVELAKGEMAVVNSPGGSQISTAAKKSSAEKALESGDAEAITKEVEKARKQLAAAAGTKPKVVRVKKDGTRVEAKVNQVAAKPELVVKENTAEPLTTAQTEQIAIDEKLLGRKLTAAERATVLAAMANRDAEFRKLGYGTPIDEEKQKTNEILNDIEDAGKKQDSEETNAKSLKTGAWWATNRVDRNLTESEREKEEAAERLADEAIAKANTSKAKVSGAVTYAANKWDETELPGKPTWDQLNDAARMAWIDAVAEGNDKLIDMQKVVERKDPDRMAVERDGDPDYDRDLTDADFADAMGIVALHLEMAGLMKAVKRRFKGYDVGQDMDEDTAGLYDPELRTVFLNRKTVRTTWKAIGVLAHEIGHALDLDLSTNALWNIKVSRRGEVTGRGLVALELTDAYLADPEVRRAYHYPLGDMFEDTTYNEDASIKQLGTRLRSNHQTKREMFAQHFRFFLLDPVSFAKRFPEAHAFFLGVIKNETSQDTPANRPASNQESNEAEEIGITSGRGPTPRVREAADRLSRIAINAPPGPVQGVIEQAPAQLQPVLHAINDGIVPSLKKFALGLTFLHDLADYAADKLNMPAIKKYAELMSEKGALKNRLEKAVTDIMIEYKHLPREVQAQVNRFLEGAAYSGKWGYQPAGRDVVEIDEGQKGQFSILPASAQEVVKRVFQYGHDTLRSRQTALDREITRSFDRQIALLTDPAAIAKVEAKRAERLDESGRILTQLRGPYSPLKRFGDHVVVAKSAAYLKAEADKSESLEEMRTNPAHYYVDFRIGNTAAQAHKREIEGGFLGGRVEAVEKETHAREIDEFQWSILQRLKDRALDEADEHGDAALKAISTAVTDMYLQSLTEASARKSELRRRGIAGANSDMMAAFDSQGKADAHFLASMQNNSEITAAMTEIRNEAKQPGDLRAERQVMFNEVHKRHAQSFIHQHGNWQDNIMRGTSFWMLLTSPAYYLQNLTQPWMMTMPVLAGRFGWQAADAVMKGSRDAAKLYTSWQSFDHTKHPHLNERKMLEALMDANILDTGVEQEFGDLSKGKTGRVFDVVTGKFSVMARQVERLNRVGSALAAYRLAYADAVANSKSAADAQIQATNYARDIVRQTHGDYAAYNAPRFFQGKMRMVMQFRKFNIIQIAMFTRMTKDAFAGATPEERALARRQLGYTLGMLGAFTGAMGMPMVSMATWVMMQAFGDDDTPENEEEFLTRLIGDKDIARILLRGGPAALGIDVSGRIGAGNMLDPIPFMNMNRAIAGRRGFKDTLFSILGPGVSLGGTLTEGISTMNRGDYMKGAELLLPNGFRNALKSYRQATEGVTDRNRTQELGPDEVSLLDTVSQAIGLPSTKLIEHNTAKFRMKDYEETFKRRATQIKNDYIEARNSGDTGATKDAREEWAALQTARAGRNFKRQPLADLLKSPTNKKKNAERNQKALRGFTDKDDE